MFKQKLRSGLPAIIGCLFISTAHAAPLALNDMQMDVVAAGGVDTVEGFVCPSISTSSVTNNDKFFPIGGGYYSFSGPNVVVPVHATNDDGAGRPGGDFATPGDTTYSAIWGIRP